MKKIICFAVFLTSYLFTPAQKPLQKKTLAITCSPAIQVAPYGQFTVQPGIEYKINEHFSFLTDFAFLLRKKFVDSSTLNRKFLRIKSEIKYHFPEGWKDFKFYLGLQCAYSFRKFDDLNGGSYANAKMDSTYSFNAASIKSPVFTSTVQMGLEFFLNHFALSFFQGLGVRVVNTSYSNVVNLGRHAFYEPRGPDYIGPTPAHYYNGTVVRGQYNIGVRLAYYFK